MAALKFVRSVRAPRIDWLLESSSNVRYQVWEAFRANSGLEPRYFPVTIGIIAWISLER